MRIASALLQWYDLHHRKLPWRETTDPYAIWLSETMLQQTRVETVIPYYHRFLQAFPTIETLANADEADVLKLWEGLGYYQRVRNLHAGAKQVVKNHLGKLPRSIEGLLSIRGIGPYTAGAIGSIAYGLPVPAIDGNVNRVISRIHLLEENIAIPSVKRRLEALAQSHVPSVRPGDYNQAVMDLGASICTPGTPDCDQCPLQNQCQAFQEGDPAMLPVLPIKKPPQSSDYSVLLIQSPRGFLMTLRKEKLLHGMWVFPMIERTATSSQNEAASPDISVDQKKLLHFHLNIDMVPGSWKHAGESRHVFTHRIWNMKMFTCSIESVPDSLPEGWRWVSPEQMEQITIPTAMRGPRQMAQQLWSHGLQP